MYAVIVLEGQTAFVHYAEDEDAIKKIASQPRKFTVSILPASDALQAAYAAQVLTQGLQIYKDAMSGHIEASKRDMQLMLEQIAAMKTAGAEASPESETPAAEGEAGQVAPEVVDANPD